MQYTLPELEGLSTALNENNKTDESDGDSFVDSNSVTGADAIRGLLSSGYASEQNGENEWLIKNSDMT